MEEIRFLHRLCTSALQIDTSIEFTAIIDSNGKLLIGKSKNKNYTPAHKKRDFTNPMRDHDNYERAFFKNKSLVSENIKTIVSLQSAQMGNSRFFRLINLNNGIFLAYLPLNEQNDKFLYIYFRASKHLEDVLYKLDCTFS